ncbi:carboxylesterase family protein [Streptomyces sp. NPDC092369]|uniref:carboxylesterase family protein n=1 Tax=Streptomyces sp. NPDC092369 TaxID=3366015 RepID=UPI0038265BD2
MPHPPPARTAGAPPQPPPSWKGVRKADAWGAACPQPVNGIDADKVPELSEDCLNLNIWTSEASSKARRPVFVWIYGGRNSAMWSGQPVHEGATLASKDTVVATFNHRVGACTCGGRDALTWHPDGFERRRRRPLALSVGSEWAVCESMSGLVSPDGVGKAGTCRSEPVACWDRSGE